VADLVLEVANSKAFRGRSPTALMESRSVAVYAAIVSTFTVVAGFIQWMRSGPRLTGHASGNMKCFPQSGQVRQQFPVYKGVKALLRACSRG
jgi:hypothetical protein